ncbi:TlpA disulfide reductase family protein [Paraglaciecola sp. MB-3u-78]|uniref:TlpA family protein disulfide reductase n=1 Tax=Paraglaciecola sp. MB-3u-78 TaxID=2058332 RepID=UPI000C333605|nr:TlpA disulfide reductase family protein [Paraglaciecola sp. MB-3u-78]PKG97445.1 TlpA family protein disulfide reductase [Paraglaciecola sp. MB-3u-78]
MKKIVIILIASLALLVGLWTQQNLKVDFTSLDGQEHRWSDSQGKWTVVNYFAEWCAPCLREIPELNHFFQQYNNDINMFAISFDPLNKSQLLALQQKYNIQFPIIDKLNLMPWNRPPNTLPTTYILDADGKVQKQLKGEQSAEKLIHTINVLKGL